MSAPISAYIGYNGGGKSLGAMVFEAAPALRRGVPVVSTVAIAHPLYRPLTSWRQIWELHDCVLLLDDISAQFPARGAMTVPPQLVVKMNTLRHDNVQVVWTGPSWTRADVVLREVTQEVTECRGYLPDKWVRQSVVVDHGWTAPRLKVGRRAVPANPMWRPHRLFKFVTHDATRFTEYTEAKVKDLKPKRERWYYRPFHGEQFLYDTVAPVNLLDHVDEGGWCLACGGKRRTRTCSCAGGVASTREGAVPQAVPDLVEAASGWAG